MKKIDVKQVDKYIFQKAIGKGGFGEVYMAKEQGTEKLVAIKRVPKSSLKSHDGKVGELLKSEVSTLRELNNTHIVKFVDYLESSNYCYLVMEYCDGGNLQTLLDQRGQFSLQQSVEYLKQILSGLNAMHQKQIIHRDVKLSNLLLANGWIIKICDLGFCKRLSAGNETFSMLGTAGSTAPEIILETGYGYKCDFFSVGVAFFQMLTGKDPFPTKTFSGFKQYVEDNKKCQIWENDVLKYPPEILDFLRGLLQVDPAKRFGWTQIKNHPIIKLKLHDELNLADISNQKHQRKSIIQQSPSKKKVKLERNQENHPPQDIIIKVEDSSIPNCVVNLEKSQKKQIQADFQKSIIVDPIERLNYLKLMDLLDKLLSLPFNEKMNITIPAFLLSKRLLLMIENFREKYSNDQVYIKLSKQDQENTQRIFKKLQAECCKLYITGNLTNKNIIKNLNEFNQPDFDEVFKQSIIDLFFSFEEVNFEKSVLDQILNIKLIIISILGGGFYQQWLMGDVVEKKEHIEENLSLLF